MYVIRRLTLDRALTQREEEKPMGQKGKKTREVSSEKPQYMKISNAAGRFEQD